MKAEEEETAAEGEVPTVEGEEAEGGEAEGEQRRVSLSPRNSEEPLAGNGGRFLFAPRSR